MRILVLGADGQVGTELRALDAADMGGRRIGIAALSRRQADLTDPDAIHAAVRASGCSAVINAAAYTAVDRAESDRDTAFAVNRDGPRHVAEACARAGLPLVHLSTDYVFDGTGSGAYREDDPTAPVNLYGLSKRDGERAVAAVLPRHAILRTSWVFASHGTNFVRTMLRLGSERSHLRVVADQTGCPTAAADIAEAAVTMARRLVTDDDSRPTGVFHYTSAEATTWHGFATAIFAERERLTGLPAPRIDAITTSDFPTPARRPANSVLDCRRIRERHGIPQPDWRRSLAAVMERLCSS